MPHDGEKVVAAVAAVDVWPRDFSRLDRLGEEFGLA
jgi:hypothetical protein